MNKIFLASDHAGFELKNELKNFLGFLGYKVEDKGPFSFDAGDDYPDFVRQAAGAVANDPEQSRGVVIGGSGQGEAMVANRFKNVRAAVYYGGSLGIVKLSREHNDTNILALGARFVSFQEAKDVVKLWLETPFSGEERHKRRIAKIEEAGR